MSDENEEIDQATLDLLNAPRPDKPDDDIGDDVLSQLNATPRAKHSEGETALVHATQGATAGFGDELAGLGSAAAAQPTLLSAIPGVGPGLARGLQAVKESVVGTDAFGNPAPDEDPLTAYRGGRDDARTLVRETKEDNPKIATTAEIAGGLISPASKVLAPAKAAPLATGLSTVRKALAAAPAAAKAGAGAGAVFGFGNSDADLTKPSIENLGRAAVDTGIGAGLGAGIGAAAGAGATVVKEAVTRSPKQLQKEVVNLLGEGLTDKQSAKVAKSKDAVFEALSTAPGADEARVAVFSKNAEEGRKRLEPVIQMVVNKRDAGYEAFRKAGKGVDAKAYYDRLIAKSNEPGLSQDKSAALKKLALEFEETMERQPGKGLKTPDKTNFGSSEGEQLGLPMPGAKEIKRIQRGAGGKFEQGTPIPGYEAVPGPGPYQPELFPKGVGPKVTKGTAGLDLERLRQFTTETQGAADAVAGANPGRAKSLKRFLSQVATEAMDDALVAEAGSDKALREAGKQIKEANRHYHGLKRIDEALEIKANKRPPSAEQRAKEVASKTLTGEARGAAIKAVGAADRGMTRLGLENTYGAVAAPVAKPVTRLAIPPAQAALSRFVAGLKSGQDPQLLKAFAAQEGVDPKTLDNVESAYKARRQ